MEVALRRRLDGVASISISQREQTVEVFFQSRRPTFSPTAFRDAAWEAGVEVLSFDIDVCGVIDQADGRHLLTAGIDRFLLPAAGVSAGRYLCVTGRVDDRADPHHMRMTNVRFGPTRQSR